MRQPREPGAVGRPRRAVRAVPGRRLDLVLPDRGGHRAARRVPPRLAAVRRDGRWSTCATGGPRRVRPTSLGAGSALGRPRRGHPRLRHGRPGGAGVLPGRALLPRRRRGRRRPVRAAQPALEGAAGAARRVRAAAGLGFHAGQLLRRRRPDRRARRHPDLRPDHRRRGLPDQGGAGAAGVPGRAAGRRTARRRTHPAAAGRSHRRRRHAARRPRLPADGRLGLRVAGRPVVLGGPGRHRSRVRPRAGPGQRRPAREHGRRASTA